MIKSFQQHLRTTLQNSNVINEDIYQDSGCPPGDMTCGQDYLDWVDNLTDDDLQIGWRWNRKKQTLVPPSIVTADGNDTPEEPEIVDDEGLGDPPPIDHNARRLWQEAHPWRKNPDGSYNIFLTDFGWQPGDPPNTDGGGPVGDVPLG